MNISINELLILEEELKALQKQHPSGTPSSPDANHAQKLYLYSYAVAITISELDKVLGRRAACEDALRQKLHGIEIDALIWAVNLTPEDHESLVWRLLLLADKVHDRYRKDGSDPRDLQLATSIVERISHIIPESHAHFSDFLLVFAGTCLSRFNSSNETSELDKAITKIKQFQTVADGNPELLPLYANILHHRFRNTGTRRDLEEAIVKSEFVLKAKNLPTDTKRDALSTLAEHYGYLYELQPANGNKYLDLAVEKGVEAANLVPEKDESADTAFVFGALAKAFYDRFLQTRNEDDLKSAIEIGKKAISLSEPQDPDKAKWTNNLGLVYDAKFEDSGDISDLQEAIDLLDEAVKLSPKNTPSELRNTHNLAHALGRRFEWTGDAESLDLAINKLRAILADSRN